MILLLSPFAAAEPLLGNLDPLGAGEGMVQPGAEVFPINPYGGSVTPELYTGVGFGHGFDVRAGLGVDVPVYYRDDGALHWGYVPPSLGFVDATARWSTHGKAKWSQALPDWQGRAWVFTVGWRVATGDATPADTLATGPEVGWSRAAMGAAWSLRASFLTHPEALPYDFGVLTTTVAVTGSGTVAPFAEAEPWFWMGMASRGNSGQFFMATPGLTARAGAWIRASRRHHVALAAVYRFDYGFELEDLSVLLKWRIGLGKIRGS